MLENKKIILGVTGGIACYKSIELVSQLRKEGAQVKVIMTEAAQRFVSPLTFSAVGDCKVFTDQFETSSGEVTHVRLAEEVDAVVIAPLTANTSAKIAHGLADNLLTTFLMAVRAPVLLAPAMNVHMWQSSIFQQNLTALKERGYNIVEPTSGFLACGASGQGRMAEAVTIFETLKSLMLIKPDFKGCRLLITAGPTREALDPVRFLSNNSSGKMGYAIAEAAAERGASVTLISGPVNLAPPRGVEVIPVENAREMYQAVLSKFSEADVVIKTAAVSDYRPTEVKQQKIKKQHENFVMALTRNPDILLHLGKNKENQILVGFAAETQNILEYARLKLNQKNLDLMVANDVSNNDAGFASDQNQVTIMDREGRIDELPLMPKINVAHKILDAVQKIIRSTS